MKKFTLLFVSLLIIVGGCNLVTFDEDINENPNLPSEATPSQLLANAMLYLPGLAEDPQGVYLAQFLSKTIYQSNSFYPPQPTRFYDWYQGPLMNVQTVIENKSSTQNEVAVAKIIKAYFFWNLTDRWGPIPFTNALQGTEEITPAYDSEKTIYYTLFDLLEEAANQINTSGTLENDIIYHGSLSKWKKLANSTRLLMALRLSEVAPSKAKKEFKQALNAGVLTSNKGSLVFHNKSNANNWGFWYEQIVAGSVREWWAMSEGVMQLMRPYNDPRLPVYADTTRRAVEKYEYNGLPYGTQESIDKAKYSLLGNAIHAPDAPVYLLTYAQVLFAKAEAAARNWISGSAETFYNKAIKKSILQWTESTNGYSAFISQPRIAFNPATAIKQIAIQRYVHLYMNGYEAWSEWRRLGYPKTMNKPLGRAVPLRLMYTTAEKLNNSENYREAVSMLENGNSLYSRVWWDVD